MLDPSQMLPGQVVPGGVAGEAQVQQMAPTDQHEAEKIFLLVLELTDPDKRESSLLELSKRRETFPDLAPILWHSFGTISALLQEIVAIYPLLAPPSLTAQASNRVCNALALLQCVASHPETRTLFLNAHIPLFLYPFLNTVSKTRPFEYLRLTSLGVIGALVKVDDADVINFLLSTEIIPLCLRIMETGSELSKTVATFIVQKILLDETGLAYICATAERFYAVSTVLANLVGALVEQPSARLLKHIVRCFLRCAPPATSFTSAPSPCCPRPPASPVVAAARRCLGSCILCGLSNAPQHAVTLNTRVVHARRLSDNPRAREALRQCLPDALRDATFSNCLKDDVTTKRWLTQLLFNITESSAQRGDAP